MLSAVSVSVEVRAYIEELMERNGLKQKDLAVALDRTQASVSQILSGHRRGTQLDLLSAIAQHFGLTLSAVIREAERRDLSRHGGTRDSPVSEGGPADVSAIATRLRQLENDLTVYKQIVQRSRELAREITVLTGRGLESRRATRSRT